MRQVLTLPSVRVPFKQAAAPARRAPTAADLTYLGSFRVPNGVASPQGVTYPLSYAPGLLASRVVGGKRTFFTTTRDDADLVFELAMPALVKGPGCPVAAVSRWWGDVYGGKRQDVNGKPMPSTNNMQGLRWDDELGGLVWGCGAYYSSQPDPTLGYAVLNDADGTATAHGPYRVVRDGSSVDSHWNRGGILRIPQDWADAHAGGNTLASGFGGYYSIGAGASYGPSLTYRIAPLAGVRDVAGTTLVGYALQAGAASPLGRCRRAADYSLGQTANNHPPNPLIPVLPGWMAVPPDPDGTGWWTACDGVEQNGMGACWPRSPGIGGLLTLMVVGTGAINYINGALGSSGPRVCRAYVYSEDELALCASGAKKPWQAVPTWFDWPTPPGWVVDPLLQAAGSPRSIFFDEPAGILYEYRQQCWKQTRYWTDFCPAVHAWKLGV